MNSQIDLTFKLYFQADQWVAVPLSPGEAGEGKPPIRDLSAAADRHISLGWAGNNYILDVHFGFGPQRAKWQGDPREAAQSSRILWLV